MTGATKMRTLMIMTVACLLLSVQPVRAQSCNQDDPSCDDSQSIPDLDTELSITGLNHTQCLAACNNFLNGCYEQRDNRTNICDANYACLYLEDLAFDCAVDQYTCY